MTFPARRPRAVPEPGSGIRVIPSDTTLPSMGLGRYDRLSRYADGRAYIAGKTVRATLTSCGFCFRSFEQAEIVVGAFGPAARICASCALEAIAILDAS